MNESQKRAALVMLAFALRGARETEDFISKQAEDGDGLDLARVASGLSAMAIKSDIKIVKTLPGGKSS
jgi:hypothetical protein